jgi:molybdopterin-guanine dinucleotide biosynthesis protein A
MIEPTYGVLLAGGLSRRMGGGDKGLSAIDGRSMLGRVIATLAPQCTGLLLNANGDPGRFESFGLPIVADDVPGFAGPLAGILAGLEWLAQKAPAAVWAVSVAADTPFIPTDLVARLHAARSAAEARLACAASAGRIHPVVGLWPVALRHDLRAFLIDEGQRRTGSFAARYRLAEAAWPDTPYDPFFNANAPQDLDEAEAIARRLAGPGW